MAREKQIAREKFKKMMEEEERKKKGGTTKVVDDGTTSSRSTDGLHSYKTVGVDNVDAGFSNTVSVQINLSPVRTFNNLVILSSNTDYNKCNIAWCFMKANVMFMRF